MDSVWIKVVGACAICAALFGCNGSSSDNSSPETPEPKAIDLTVLHINDHHSHLVADDIKITLGDVEFETELGGFPRVVTMFYELEDADSGNVLRLHAGDAITGTVFYTLFQGEADADMMNEVCFDAFALGNHEFDGGDEGLKVFLDFLNAADSGCDEATPVLAANIQPQVGTPLAMQAVNDYIQPYTIEEFEGERVGIIGIDIVNKTQNSSSPLETTEFTDEIETAQQYIDELTEDGVNKIILLTHYQYQNDLAMAAQLTGVDVIVGGDSHSLLGNGFETLGLNPVGEYPTQVTNASGEPVCVVQAWQYSAIVGELNVSFNENGVVTSCTGTPHMLLGSTFIVENPNPTGEDDEEIELTGDARDELVADINANSLLSIVAPNESTTAKLDVFNEQRLELVKTKIGTATENLCLERIPGQGKSSLCDASATAQQGSDISNIVAQAFLFQSLEADIALQNAGGVRIDVPAGDITIDTAYTLLPFANTLVNIEMTGQEIVNTLEDAMDYALDPEGSSGAYPYAANLRYDINSMADKGGRFTNIEAKFRGDDDWHAIALDQTYTVVTNNFIAGGRDGYVTMGEVAAQPGKLVDTYLDYAQSFVDWVRSVETVSKLPQDQYSTKSYQ